jgi:hypothetical protein
LDEPTVAFSPDGRFVLGECRHGPWLDRELERMIGIHGPVEPKLFTYLRYNAELTHE